MFPSDKLSTVIEVFVLFAQYLGQLLQTITAHSNLLWSLGQLVP